MEGNDPPGQAPYKHKPRRPLNELQKCWQFFKALENNKVTNEMNFVLFFVPVKFKYNERESSKSQKREKKLAKKFSD